MTTECCFNCSGEKALGFNGCLNKDCPCHQKPQQSIGDWPEGVPTATIKPQPSEKCIHGHPKGEKPDCVACYIGVKPDTPVAGWEEEFMKQYGYFCDGERIYGIPLKSLLSFIRQTLAKATAEARREEQEHWWLIRKNEIAFVKDLPHRCPSCGKPSPSLTYGEALAINAMFGQCHDCVASAGSVSSLSNKDPQ